MNPDVLFLSPNYPPEMRNFTRGLARAGAKVHAVGDTPVHELPPDVRGALTSYLHVPALGNVEEVRKLVHRWLGGRRPDQVESLWEPLTLLAAQLRADMNLPGMKPDVVMGFRDKPLMRAKVEAAGLRIPRTMRVATVADARRAADLVGFPLIIKPVDGAGSADTHRCDGWPAFEAALESVRHVPAVTVEEFVTGEELTYETLCVNGEILYESVCRYEPNVLVARRNEWISPIIQALASPTAREQAGINLGRRVIPALGMGTGITHMEWFRDDGGEAIFGEIACRPPGANMVDLMNYADDQDLYFDWGHAIVSGKIPTRPARPWSACIVFKRAEGQGTIRAIEGLETFVARHREHIARIDLLPIGTARRDWQQTFLADGNLVVRHPLDDVALEIAQEAAATIRVFAR